MSSIRRMSKDEERELALGDLFYFTKYVLGRDLLEKRWHQELCEFMTQWRRTSTPTKIILQPRGTFKTTICSEAYPLWCYLRNPDIRIFLGSYQLDFPQTILSVIKEHLSNCEKLHWLFGKLHEKAAKWTERTITLPRRAAWKEPTIICGAVGKSETGPHYDLFILDDLVNNKNCDSPVLMQEVISWWQSMQPLRETERDGKMPGRVVMPGTRWNDGDLYGWMLERWEDGNFRDLDVWLRRANELYCPDCKKRLDWPVLNNDGQYCPKCNVESKRRRFFPSKLTNEYLDGTLQTMGSEYLFNCQYQNDPRGDSTTEFNRQMLKTWVPPPAPPGQEQNERPEQLHVYAMLDPAVTTEKYSCYSAIVVAGIGANDCWYILHAERNKYEFPELVNWVAEINRIYHPIEFGIEVYGQQKVLYERLDEHLTRWHRENPARRPMPPLVSVTKEGSEQAKDVRIRATLLPLYRQGRVWHAFGLSDLEDELLRFPRAKTKDTIDAWSRVPALGVTRPKVEAIGPAYGTHDYVAQNLKRMKRGPILIGHRADENPTGSFGRPNRIMYPPVKVVKRA